jgi:glycosyltransferase involved in cell wall biosynthesis
MSVDSYPYSIILPVRNGGEYVKGCVTSILSQPFSDFNLHILDNNSNDGTLEWIKSLNDKRIKIYPSETSLSMEENWGRIVSIPKNEFMTMIGHDDILDKDYLSVINELIRKYPNASLYQTHFRFINADGNIVRKCKRMPETQSVSEFMESIFTNTLDTMGTGYMMRSSDYDELGGIHPYPNLLFADHELWIRLTAISYKVTANEECFAFRVHESVSRKSVAAKYIQAFFRFMDFLKELQFKDQKVNEVIKTHIPGYIRYYCRSLSHRLLRTPEPQREGITVTSFIEQCKKYADELAPANQFYPYKQFNIRLAKMIDNNILSRRLYLLFKKIFKKPIYS